MNIELVNGHYKYVFSVNEEKEICNLFINHGYSMRKIARECKCTTKTISLILDKYDIDHSRGNTTSYNFYYKNGLYDSALEEEIILKIKDIPSKKQKYCINDHYFDNIRDPEVIYTIGFLYADGCNSDNQSITLSLEEQDKYILEVINDNIENEKPISFVDMSNKHDFGYTYKNQYQLTIYNTRIANVLNILGVVPRKSLILSFPKWLHPDLYSHFIRGVFDGDGSIYRYYSKNGNPRNTVLTITSTENFIQALMDISVEYINVNPHMYDASCHNGITKVYSICGAMACRKFLDWIYKDSSIHLQRKYERYCSYYNLDYATIA